MKRAQIIGQVFIYILAIVVFTVILLYGYSAITNFIEKGERVAFIQFQTKLETEIASIAPQYGDVIIFNEKNPMKIPSTYTEVCFVSQEATIGDIPDNYQIIEAAVSAELHKSTENVFLTPPAPSPIYVGRIKLATSQITGQLADFVGEPFLCINVTKGRLDMRIQGAGTSTIISQ